MPKWLTLTAALLPAAFLFCAIHAAHALVYVPNVTGLYHFENSNDSSGNSRNLTEVGAVGYTSTSSGKLSKAGNTSSTGQWYTQSSTMNISGDFTIGFWLNPQESFAGADSAIISKHDTTYDMVSLGAMCAGSNWEFRHNNNCHTFSTPNPATSTWRWYLIARSGNNVDWYIDNVVTSTFVDSDMTNRNANVYVNGQDGGFYKRNFYIDELFFMNARISTSTRDALWNSSSGAEICITAGCDSTSTPYIVSNSLSQNKSDCTTNLAEGTMVADTAICFKATLNSSTSNQLQLQVQISTSTAFTNILSSTSASVAPNNSATTTIPSIPDGRYYWQARVVDTVNNASSTWQQFGTDNVVDFVVDTKPQVEISDGSITGLYHFEDAADSSGNSRNLTGSGIGYLGGKLLTAGNTSSTGYWTAASSSMNIAGDFTIGFWLNAQESFAGADSSFISRHNGNYDMVALGAMCAANSLEFRHNSECHSFSQSNPATSTWHWHVIARTGTRVDWYIDDVATSTFTDGQMNNINAPVYLNGQDGGFYKRAWYMDELFFANQRLATSTLDALYNMGNGSEVCVTPGCGTTNLTTSTLHQSQSNGATIDSGGTTPDNVAKFGATLTATGTVQLQVEVQLAGTPFTGTPNATSSYVASGANATATYSGLLNRSYHWQARAMSSSTIGAIPSPWRLYGATSTSVDFRVSSLTNAASVQFSATSSDALAYSATPFQFAATDSSTIEFWYRTPAATSSVINFIDTRSTSTSKGYLIKRHQNDGIEFSLACASGIMDFYAAKDLATNRNGSSYDVSGIWHQVAITKGTGTDINAFTFYFDGVEKPKDTILASSTISGNCYDASTTNNIWFGKDAVSVGLPNYLTGNLDEVRIWGGARSSSTIATFWNQEIGFSTTNLLGLWHFTNTSMESMSGNGTSSQNGTPVFASSTPFGHFVMRYSSVTSSQMTWASSTQYLTSWNAAVAQWKLENNITITSTTVTSAANLIITDASDTSVAASSAYCNVSPLGWPCVFPTSTKDTIFFNVPRIEGPPPLTSDQKLTTAMHELGHALGLDHSYFGNIMDGGALSSVTSTGPQDKSDYHFLWGN